MYLFLLLVGITTTRGFSTSFGFWYLFYDTLVDVCSIEIYVPKTIPCKNVKNVLCLLTRMEEEVKMDMSLNFVWTELNLKL